MYLASRYLVGMAYRINKRSTTDNNDPRLSHVLEVVRKLRVPANRQANPEMNCLYFSLSLQVVKQVVHLLGEQKTLID